jgi:ABC-type multidrug transport system ATPase subunit
VVSHQTFLYDDLTAYENLRFFGRLFGVDGLDAQIHQVSHLMGVEERLHHKVRTLSHGMQKRLSLARALLHNPPILLLDEPETGLDQEALAALERLLQDRAGGRTIIMTTHDLDRGLALGSRIAILARGRIVYEERRELLDAAALRGKYAQLAGAGP